MNIQPLAFKYLSAYFPSYDFEELVEIFAVTGGIPYYLQQMNPDISPEQNNAEQVFYPYGVLYQEAEFLLMQEFISIATYSSILHQIAKGKTKVNEIRQALSLKGDISSFLANLQTIDLVKRQVPFGEGYKSRRGRYYLKDNYLLFWYQFVNPVRSRIVLNQSIQLDRVRFNTYFGYIFESIVSSLIHLLVDVVIIDTGRWWFRDTEIDLVCKHETGYLFVEVKWSSLGKMDAQHILADLKVKSQQSRFKGEFSYMLVCKTFKQSKSDLEELRICDTHDLQKLLIG